MEMENKELGVPIVAQQKQIRLVSMRMQVRSLASLRELRIQRCCELLCRSEIAQILHCCGCGSVLTTSLGPGNFHMPQVQP